MAYKAKAARIKQQSVSEFAKLFDEYPIIGAIDMCDLPASQLQIIRAKLREKVIKNDLCRKKIKKQETERWKILASYLD